MHDYGLSANPLRERLQAGEHILWEGKPNKRAYLLRGAWYMIPFSLLWGGFAIFWEVGVITSGAPLLFWLWGIPFVLMGLYLIGGRFFLAARDVDHTFYAVTNRRILIQKGAFQRHSVELSLATLPYLQLTEQGNGRGTIYFALPGPFQMFTAAGWPGARGPQAPAFESIERAGEVQRIIESARNPAR